MRGCKLWLEISRGGRGGGDALGRCLGNGGVWRRSRRLRLDPFTAPAGRAGKIGGCGWERREKLAAGVSEVGSEVGSEVAGVFAALPLFIGPAEHLSLLFSLLTSDFATETGKYVLFFFGVVNGVLSVVYCPCLCRGTTISLFHRFPHCPLPFFARAWLLYALQTHVIPFFFLLLRCVFLLLLEMDIKENGAAPRRRERPARKGLSSPVERKPSGNPAETRWERWRKRAGNGGGNALGTVAKKILSLAEKTGEKHKKKN